MYIQNFTNFSVMLYELQNNSLVEVIHLEPKSVVKTTCAKKDSIPVRSYVAYYHKGNDYKLLSRVFTPSDLFISIGEIHSDSVGDANTFGPNNNGPSLTFFNRFMFPIEIEFEGTVIGVLDEARANPVYSSIRFTNNGKGIRIGDLFTFKHGGLTIGTYRQSDPYIRRVWIGDTY